MVRLVGSLLASADDAKNNLYVLTAFGGGIISFLSPCVLPIVPAYLGFVSGITIGELQEARGTTLRRIALNTAMFVLGFTVVFVLLGLAATSVGHELIQNKETLTRISGGFVLLMAFYLAGSQLLMTPRLYQEFRFHPHLERFGPAAAPIAGAAFGLGWTPCIGAILGSVLSFAQGQGDTARAAVLLTAYSLGLGCSFLVVGLLFGRLAVPLAWVRRHARAFTLFSAAVLAFFGLVLLTDNLGEVTARLSSAMDSLGLRFLVEIG
jgi:cytochrome c-type biogenesis protein